MFLWKYYSILWSISREGTLSKSKIYLKQHNETSVLCENSLVVSNAITRDYYLMMILEVADGRVKRHMVNEALKS